MTGRYFFSVILLICVATAAAQCPYTLITKTGIQAGNAASGAQVNLNLISPNQDQHIIRNISSYNIQGPHYQSFQNNTVDVFIFDERCAHYCNMSLGFEGSRHNSWNLEFFVLRVSYEDNCNFTRRYSPNTTLFGQYDFYQFQYHCSAEAVGTEKQKLTEASLLRPVGRLSYTT